MARGRFVSKSISVSKKFNDIPGKSGKLRRFPQLLYLMILPHADDYGRLQADPQTIKALCCPLFSETIVQIETSLRILHDVGLVQWYEVDGNKFLQINNFDEHQVGLHKRTSPKIPGPSGKFPEIPSEVNRSEVNNAVPGKPGNAKTDKKLHLDYVLLTEEQHEALGKAMGALAEEYIARLNDYVGSKGVKYNSHYHTILNWWRKDGKPGPQARKAYDPLRDSPRN